MPYSKKQKISACLALAARKKKVPVNKLRDAALDMYKTMTLKELEDFCHSSVKKK